MSISIDTVRTDEESEELEESRESGLPPAAWITADDALDVSELTFDRVAAYARQADRDVYLERKGGRTRLVAAHSKN
ncbi:hypothetical protein BRD04_03885 [Halobacteriales archaeon QS_9_67_17]|nr:MAG: hypothetical protein BRD04_03885 [Halobacteriales archaeon QS_9_67_17]